MTSLQSAPPRHRHPVPPLRIAMLGTRGVPADGGLESAVEEIGRRLVRHGHDVTVYGRAAGGPLVREHLGMRCVAVPALPVPSIEARSRTAFAAVHLLTGRRTDVAFLFDAANAPLVPLLRARGTAIAVHLDSTDRQHRRDGRHRPAERAAVREADALIADSPTIRDRTEDDFGVPAQLIGYGARIVHHVPTDLLEPLELVPGGFHLALARFATGDHLGEIVEGYHRSDAHLPLVVAPLGHGPAAHADRIRALAAVDPRIRVLASVPDERLLDQLHAHAAASLHGPSIGAADPSLLRTMGAGTAVVAWDAVANREIVGTAGSYFSSAAQVARQIEEVERYPFRFRDIGELMQERARTRFDWDVVAEHYQALAAKLARGYSTRGMSSGRPIAPSRTSLPIELEAQRG